MTNICSGLGLTRNPSVASNLCKHLCACWMLLSMGLQCWRTSKFRPSRIRENCHHLVFNNLIKLLIGFSRCGFEFSAMYVQTSGYKCYSQRWITFSWSMCVDSLINDQSTHEFSGSLCSPPLDFATHQLLIVITSFWFNSF